jgi:hypothetical protein
MDYDGLIASTYNWFSIDKLIWFLIFFWLAIPVFLLVPAALEMNLFYQNKLWLVNTLYSILYMGFLIGLLTLIYNCLNKEKFSTCDFTITKFIDVILLVFLEFWYVLVWNIHKSYRFTQLLLLFGIPLLYFYSQYVIDSFIDFALNIFVLSYLIIIIYNFIRLSFSVTYFMSGNFSLKDSIKESWHMTHNKFPQVFFSYLIILGSVFVLFTFIGLFLGAVLNLILMNYFISSVSYDIALFLTIVILIGPAIIAYHNAYLSLYEQLYLKERSNRRVKKFLASKVFEEELEEFIEDSKKKKKKVKKKTKKKSSKKNTKKKVKKKTSKNKKAKKKSIKKKK